MTETFDFFVTGGTLRINDPSYVTRPADHDLLRLLQAGEFCYVLTPRQMGKSSLMVRTAQRLREEGARVAVIDLTSIGTGSSELSVDQWYLGLLSRVRTQLRLSTDVQVWWDEHAALGIAQRFITFLHNVLLTECTEPMVILIDEIDSTLNLNFRDDFFAAIRAVYNERATNPTYQRLTFALFGVATPTDLIQDRERTPFNIGRRIDLSEFTLTDAQPLRDELAITFLAQADAILQRIFYWTNGHPYLTQKLCQVLQLEKSLDTEAMITVQVDAAVRNTFLSEDGRKDPNLTFVQDRIASSPNSEKRRMLQLYQRVQRNENVPDDDRSSVQNRLELYGLIGVAQGQLQVRNRIYQQVFDSAWIASMMPVDRRQRRAVLAGVGALALALGIALFIFLQPAIECSVFSEQFIENQDSSVRLSALASLFDQGERCRSVALELFYSLQPDEHESLFLGLNDYPNERERLKTVIDGVYRTLDTVPKHDLELLEIWITVLQNAGVSDVDQLLVTLHNWQEGRVRLAAGDPKAAVEALSEVLVPNHPVLYYDYAVALTANGQYTDALTALDKILEMDQPTPVPTSDYNAPSPLVTTSVAITSLLSFLPTPTPTEEVILPLPGIVPTMLTNSLIETSLPGNTDATKTPATLTLNPVGYLQRFRTAESLNHILKQTIEENLQLSSYYHKNRTKYPALATLLKFELGLELAVINNSPVPIGEQVTFTAIVASGNTVGLTFFWDFGDGQTKQGQIVQHAYKSLGTFNAIAMVTDGITSTRAETIVSITRDSALTERGFVLIPAKVTPREGYWKLIRSHWFYEDESSGRHHIFIDVLDSNGQRLTGVPVTIEWKDYFGTSVTTMTTESKLGEPFATSYPMYVLAPAYSAQPSTNAPADRVEGMGLGSIEEPSLDVRTSYLLVWQWTIADGSPFTHTRFTSNGTPTATLSSTSTSDLENELLPTASLTVSKLITITSLAPAPMPVPLLQAVVVGCQPSNRSSRFEGYVYMDDQPVNGYRVVFSYEADGPWVTQPAISGTNASGFYAHIISAGVARVGSWYAWVVAQNKQRISTIAAFTTDGEGGDCNIIPVNFLQSSKSE